VLTVYLKQPDDGADPTAVLRMRSYVLAVLPLLALLDSPGAAQASQYVLKPHHSCKAHYVRKVERVKVNRHGHVKRIKQTFCVHVVPKPPTSSTTTTTTATPTPTPAPAPTPSPAPTPAKPLAIEVTTYEGVGGGSINVENPEYNKPQAGKRFVAVGLSLTNVGRTTISSDANLDATVIGSDSQSYTFALGVERKGCTDFSYGSFTLTPGAHAVGCIVYELPEGVKIAHVQWNDGLPGEETTRTF
jgi:hypothetical protein